MEKETKKTIIIILGIVLFALIFAYVLAYFMPQPSTTFWHCERVECDNVVFINVSFDGSPMYFKMRNCRTIGCTRFNLTEE